MIKFLKGLQKYKKINFEGIYYRNDIGHQVRRKFSKGNSVMLNNKDSNNTNFGLSEKEDMNTNYLLNGLSGGVGSA